MTPFGAGAPAESGLRCSRAWNRDDLPAWGTASRAHFWVALEQPGPWGHKALTQSHLPAELGTRLESLCADAGGRAILIRRPGRHADDGHEGERTVLVAGGLAARQPRPWLGRLGVHEVEPFLDLLEQHAAGLGTATVRPDWLQPARAALAVCTNARRDQCCALEGRALALEMSAGDAKPGQADGAGHEGVWECSHLGGHRFSPTALVLPTGQSLARLGPDLARQALTEAALGRAVSPGPVHDRGLSALEPPLQVADAWARWQRLPQPETITQLDQNRWRVTTVGTQLVLRRDQGPETLPSSCGAAMVPVVRWTVEQECRG